MHKNNSFANRYLVSIIIATRNAEEQISECLDSVKKYAPENVEIVIVDGGSEDGTLSILTQYGISNFISEKDQGIYDAFNKGIRRANGQWFYFLGSDDRLLPGFGNMLQNLKEIHILQLAYCKIMLITRIVHTEQHRRYQSQYYPKHCSLGIYAVMYMYS